MEINGKELSSHDGGNIIYYDHILIKSLNNPELNQFSTLEYWVKYLTNNPDFCGCKYHSMMKGHCQKINKALNG